MVSAWKKIKIKTRVNSGLSAVCKEINIKLKFLMVAWKVGVSKI